MNDKKKFNLSTSVQNDNKGEYSCKSGAIVSLTQEMGE